MSTVQRFFDIVDWVLKMGGKRCDPLTPSHTKFQSSSISEKLTKLTYLTTDEFKNSNTEQYNPIKPYNNCVGDYKLNINYYKELSFSLIKDHIL